MKTETTVVTLSTFLTGLLTPTKPSASAVLRFIKDYNVQVAATAKVTKGVSFFITHKHAEELRALIMERKAKKLSAVPPVEETSETDLHIGALEAKCDRIETGVKRLHDEVAVLVKANNVLADKLSKVLSSLGAN